QTLSTVWWRRVMYFLMLGSAGVLVAWPWLMKSAEQQVFSEIEKPECSGGFSDVLACVDYGFAAVFDAVRNAVGGLVPAYVKRWTDAVVDSPILTISVILLVMWFWRW